MSETLRCMRCGAWIAKTDHRGAVVKVNRGVFYQNLEGERAGLSGRVAKRPVPPRFPPEMVECRCEPVDATIYMFTDAWKIVPFGEWERFAHGEDHRFTYDEPRTDIW